MLRDAAVDLIMKRLGNRNNATLRNDIINEMAYVQEQLLEATYPLPWFLIQKDDTLVTVADTETVALPAGFLDMWEDGGLAYVDSDGEICKLVREDYDIIRKKAQGNATGAPEYYDIVGANIYFQRIPNDAYNLELWMYQRDTLITGEYGDASNLENSWLREAADWLMGEVGMIIAGQQLVGDKVYPFFEKQAARGREQLLRRITAREENSKERFMEG